MRWIPPVPDSSDRLAREARGLSLLMGTPRPGLFGHELGKNFSG
jgi:hypothetical protein